MFNILLLGEGDFTFTLAFLHKLKWSTVNEYPLLSHIADYQNHELHDDIQLNLICTSFDNERNLYHKYPHCRQILPKILRFDEKNESKKQHKKYLSFLHQKQKLEKSKIMKIHFHIQIKHGINACHLSNYTFLNSNMSFDLVIFNHPHIGIEDCDQNSSLVINILQSISDSKLLSDLGIIWLTLFDGQFQNWNILQKLKQCNEHRLLSNIEYIGNFVFYDGYYTGYQTRRHQNGHSFRNANNNRIIGDARNESKMNKNSFTHLFCCHENEKNIQDLDCTHMLSVKQMIDCMNELMMNYHCLYIQSLFECDECHQMFDQKRSLIAHQHMKLQQKNLKAKNENII